MAGFPPSAARGSMTPADFRPRLRPHLRAAPNGEPDRFALQDSRRITTDVVTMSRLALALAQLFDGTRTLGDVRRDAGRSGIDVPLDVLGQLATALDGALLLDSPAFQAYVTGPVRRPSCIGCYPDDPAAIRAQLAGLFTGPGGPGLPTAPGSRASDGRRLRAVLVPHMDYDRGGVTYGWGFKELAEQTDARLFVIVATSHYSANRFGLTRMNFATPLGTVETDQGYVDRVVKHYGDGLFDDPHAHLPEHSIELEVVLLQYLFEGHGPFRIVPLLTGSYHDRIANGRSPDDAADIARMVAALRVAEAEADEPVCYVISGDLAHIGPKFRDPDPVGEPLLTHSKKQDDALLARLVAADPAGYFDVIAAEGDERRICGLPPTWLTLSAAKPATGSVLHYGRYVHPTGHESVSFASAAFYE